MYESIKYIVTWKLGDGGKRGGGGGWGSRAQSTRAILNLCKGRNPSSVTFPRIY